MKAILYLLIFLPTLASAAQQEQWIEFDKLYGSFGSMTEFVGDVQIDSAGNKNKFEFNPLLAVGLRLNSILDTIIVTEALWVLPRTPGDGYVTENLFAFKFEIGHPNFNFYHDRLQLRTGVSQVINIMTGTGEEVYLSNGGGGQTSKFYTPNETSTTYNNTLDLIAEYLITQNFSAKSNLFIYQLFNSERRAYSYTLQLNYYLDL